LVSTLQILRFVLGLDQAVLYVDHIGIFVLRHVVNLLGFSPHETVGCGHVSEVKYRHVVGGEQILLGVLQECLESLDKLFLVDHLHVVFGVELVSELAEELGVGFDDHDSELFPVERARFVEVQIVGGVQFLDI